MFFVSPNSTGAAVRATPLKNGPRHCGQCAGSAELAAPLKRTTVVSAVRINRPLIAVNLFVISLTSGKSVWRNGWFAEGLIMRSYIPRTAHPAEQLQIFVSPCHSKDRLISGQIFDQISGQISGVSSGLEVESGHPPTVELSLYFNVVPKIQDESFPSGGNRLSDHRHSCACRSGRQSAGAEQQTLQGPR